MSNFSDKREEETTAKVSGPSWRWIVLAILVLIAIWISYDYFSYRKVSTLDAFAKCTNEKGTRMYGAWWCPHCAEQKEMFGYAFHYVAYTECGIEGQRHGMNEQCTKAGIQHFPTWQFPDGHREEGTMPLPDLAAKTGCKLP